MFLRIWSPLAFKIFCSICHCRSGSVVANMTLVFKDKNSVPSASNATSQLESELTTSTSLNVIPGSVSAGKSNKKKIQLFQCVVFCKLSENVIIFAFSNVSVSTSTSSSAVRNTMGSMAIFSLTLLAVVHILTDY